MAVSKVDVLVLGAGPAGLATARALGLQTGLSVWVVDVGDQQRERVGESAPPDLLIPLDKLHLSEAFQAGQHVACPGNASRWGRAGVGYNDFIYSPMGPAWRLNRRAFDAMLVRAAQASGAVIAWRTRFSKAHKAADQNTGYHLKLCSAQAGSRWIQARWVIDATGVRARFAREIGVGRQINDQLFALACFSDVHTGDMSRQTLLEASEHGWWYAALLPDQRLITMFVTELGKLREMQRNQSWQADIQRTQLIGPALAKLQLANTRQQAVPIYCSLLDSVQGDDWVAVGDAASSFDPIAAQGLYKGLMNGIAAANLIAEKMGGQSKLHKNNSASYQQQLVAAYQDYYQNRRYLYSLEQRWKNAPFWRRRNAILEPMQPSQAVG